MKIIVDKLASSLIKTHELHPPPPLQQVQLKLMYWFFCFETDSENIFRGSLLFLSHIASPVMESCELPCRCWDSNLGPSGQPALNNWATRHVSHPSLSVWWHLSPLFYFECMYLSVNWLLFTPGIVRSCSCFYFVCLFLRLELRAVFVLFHWVMTQ